MEAVVFNDNRSLIWPYGNYTIDMVVPEASKVIFSNQLISSAQMICSDSGIIVGNRDTLFQSSYEVDLFKKHVFKKFDIPPRKFNKESPFPIKIALFTRTATRNFHEPNPSQIKSYLMNGRLSKFNKNGDALDIQIYKDFDSNTHYTTQIKLFSSPDIIIVPHGAATLNTIFSDPDVPVIEIFPHNYRKETYRLIAGISGRPYFEFYAKPLPVEKFVDMADKQQCDEWTAIDIQLEGYCHRVYKFQYLKLNLEELESQVELAIQHLLFNHTDSIEYLL
eukprot:c34326_g1_i1.p1 GENE.c34326_g1_i1~~c34326_g1_i1.p1  ORF type:complete len:278 (-),score=41.95 c34326_g1_i1:1-834(-)